MSPPTLLPHPLVGGAFPSPVPPGTGWPQDPAGPSTAVARDAAEVARRAAQADLGALDAEVSVCRACPRLVAWRETVATTKRRAYEDQPYWGRPVPGWGPDDARVLIVGLAPAVHGGNRTGRIFTGDRSGDWLFAALHRAGLASQASSLAAGDDQTLLSTRIAAAVRCAPPDNAPLPAERDACRPWLDREVTLLLPTLRSVVALGAFAWSAALTTLGAVGLPVPRPRPRFTHGAEVTLGRVLLLGCFHPSQQNTFTGKLTEPMTDAVIGRAAAHAVGGPR